MRNVAQYDNFSKWRGLAHLGFFKFGQSLALNLHIV